MEYKDQLGRQIQLSKVPVRIVSLVPSQTELLVDLGLRDRIVGITKFCVHPSDLRHEKQIVGGTKQLHNDRVEALLPDIILCNKEENTEQIVNDMEAIAPVHVSDIKDLEDAFSLISMYGAIFQVIDKAHSLVNSIKNGFNRLSKVTTDTPNLKVAYFIWRNPWMVAGGDTFINHLLVLCGFKNEFSDCDRYPEIELRQLENIDYVFLSSEPFPFKEKHGDELKEFTDAQIIQVDGEYFSWYGSRLLKAIDYFITLKKRLS